MARHETAFNTDDPLLIEVGNIYRAWRDSAGPEASFIVDIQNAIAPYLSHPENAAKGLPTNIGFEQTPEQKRENGRRAIVDSTPTVTVKPGKLAMMLNLEPDTDLQVTPGRTAVHYEPAFDNIDPTEG